MRGLDHFSMKAGKKTPLTESSPLFPFKTSHGARVFHVAGPRVFAAAEAPVDGPGAA